jgi:hypothetical protein
MTDPRSFDHSSKPIPAGGKQLVALVISWAIVGIPAAWGVAQTVRKSVPLFTAPAAHPAATQPGDPAR